MRLSLLWAQIMNYDVVLCKTLQILTELIYPLNIGEELRITYIDTSMVRDMRQSFLEENYGFTCNCSRCRDGD